MFANIPGWQRVCVCVHVCHVSMAERVCVCLYVSTRMRLCACACTHRELRERVCMYLHISGVYMCLHILRAERMSFFVCLHQDCSACVHMPARIKSQVCICMCLRVLRARDVSACVHLLLRVWLHAFERIKTPAIHMHLRALIES